MSIALASVISPAAGLIIFSPLGAEKLVPSLEAAASAGVGDIVCLDNHLKAEEVLRITSRSFGGSTVPRVHLLSTYKDLSESVSQLTAFGPKRWGVFPAHEVAVEPAAALARHLNDLGMLSQGVPHSESAAKILRVKDFFRFFIDRELNNNPDLITIWHQLFAAKSLSVEVLKAAGAPNRVIIKPRNSSGSKGVEHIDLQSPEADTRLQSVYDTLQFLKGNPNARDIDNEIVEVEKFVEGEEFAIDGFYRGGEVYVGAIHWKPDIHRDWLHTGSFMESNFVSIPPDFPGYEVLVRVNAAVVSSISGLGDTVFHAEYRLDPRTNKVFPIEIAGRVGGGSLAESAEQFSGVNLYEAGVRMALGLPPAFPTGPYRLTGDGIVFPERDGILQRFYFQLPGETSIDLVEGIEEEIVSSLNRYLKSVPRVTAAKMLENFSSEVPFNSFVRRKIQQSFSLDSEGIDVDVQNMKVWSRRGLNVVGFPGVHLGGFLMTSGSEAVSLKSLAELIVGMNLCFSVFRSEVSQSSVS